VSADAVCDALHATGHEAVTIDVDRTGAWSRNGTAIAIEPGRGLLGADVVFSTLQGPFGEDGAVQGLLECLAIPFVGSGVLASAICQDKAAFKALMARTAMPQGAYRAVQRSEFESGSDAVLAGLESLGPIVFVKPADQGSSVGVSRADSPQTLLRALEVAFEYGSCAVVEAAAAGVEIECAVIGNDEPIASEPGEVVMVGDGPGWFDYQTKYTPDSIQLFMPPRIPRRSRKRVRELARQIFLCTGCTGLARVDFFVDGRKVLVNEINTMPVLKKTSAFPLLFERTGIPYTELIGRLLNLALEHHAARRRYRH
jgi:D-alanine-D-alanine ligase